MYFKIKWMVFGGGDAMFLSLAPTGDGWMCMKNVKISFNKEERT
ncbi:hypothetical protein MKY85_29635 [Paenibacillus sp. FSL R5-0749]